MYFLHEEGKVQISWLIIQDEQLTVDPDFKLVSQPRFLLLIPHF